MSSIVAIVGRPNVGKSSIFNNLTGSNAALVANFSGLTRDRQYGRVKNSSAILIDTGGIGSNSSDLYEAVLDQTNLAIDEANFHFLVVDAKEGLQVLDKEIAKKLRKTSKQIYLIVNKVDNKKDEARSTEFHELGLDNKFLVSSAHNLGLGDLRSLISNFAPLETNLEVQNKKDLSISIIGRPNVGKSTLINKLSGDSRVLVSEESGTTRDSIEVPIKSGNKNILLIDTAGVRKKRAIVEEVEKFSVAQSLEAVKKGQVVLHLIDSQEPLVDQDMHILGLILSIGRPIILVVNKIDLLDKNQINVLKSHLKRRLSFANFISVHFTSAKTGKGIKALLNLALIAYKSSKKDLDTNFLNKILIKAIQQTPPPLVGRFRPKLRYVHQGGKSPPILIIHGNNVKNLKKSYKKYIENFFRESLELGSTPLVVDFLDSKNPFERKANKLTDKQKKNRKRIIKRTKK